MSDDLSKVEYYDVVVEKINGVKYLKFSTSHFSNYIIALKEDDTVTSKDDLNDSENPAIGDRIIAYICMAVISSIGLVSTSLILKKKIIKR